MPPLCAVACLSERKQMSISLKYQGLPPGCGLVELVQELAAQNPGKAHWVQFISSWLRRGEQRRGTVVHPAPGCENDYHDLGGKEF
jgi:hypothetical protein